MNVNLNEHTLGEFLDAVASRSPAPGGGAVASVTAALAAALGRMVLEYSKGKKSLAAHAAEHDAALLQLQAASLRSIELAAADALAYGKLNALWKLDPENPERKQQWSAAVAGAIQPPRDLMTCCLNMLELMSTLLGKTNKMLDSDLAIAAVLAEAAARAGTWNVRINLPLMHDAVAVNRLSSEIERDMQQCRSLCDQIERACRASLPEA